MGKIYCVVGKSCVGKSTFYDAVIADNVGQNLIPVIPYTTRPKRVSDVEGQQYHFVSVEEMTALARDGKIIEQRCYDTVHGLWYYFTTDFGFQSDKNYLLITTLDALDLICQYYGEQNVVVIYLYVDDEIRLRRSIARESRQRSPNYAEVCRRYLADEEDFKEANIAKYKSLYKIDTGRRLKQCVEEFASLL